MSEVRDRSYSDPTRKPLPSSRTAREVDALIDALAEVALAIVRRRPRIAGIEKVASGLDQSQAQVATMSGNLIEGKGGEHARRSLHSCQ